MGQPRSTEHRLRCQALLFDLDGVLVDSSTAVERAWTQWAGEQGLRAADILAVAHGRRTADTIREVAPGLDAVVEAARIEEREVGLANATQAYDGAAALLANLPEGRWAIVTSGPSALATARLRGAGLPAPRVMVTADDVEAGKPHPEGYLAAAAALGVRPTECVVLEDAPAGVQAARAAGMGVVGIASTHREEALGDADLVVAALAVLGVSADPDGALVVLRRPAATRTPAPSRPSRGGRAPS